MSVRRCLSPRIQHSADEEINARQLLQQQERGRAMSFFLFLIGFASGLEHKVLVDSVKTEFARMSELELKRPTPKFIGQPSASLMVSIGQPTPTLGHQPLDFIASVTMAGCKFVLAMNPLTTQTSLLSLVAEEQK